MRPILAITMGDPAGIGSEIAVKALDQPAIYERCVPIVIGDTAAIADAVHFCGRSHLTLNEIHDPAEAKGTYGTIDTINLGLLEPNGWQYGKVQQNCGEAAFQYVKHAIELALAGKVHGTVTGPINKEAINLAGYHYSGHTEIYGDLTHTKDFGMLLMSQSLKVIHVTTHVSMRHACDLITKERVLTVIKLADEALRLLGYDKPKIGVAGFNAHASENGLFGDEEAKGIIPAIEAAAAEGYDVDGPVPPDTVFVKAKAGKYDVVVAMYHDQGHIPLKLDGFKMDEKTGLYTSMSGINCTVGLPIIRTSVDHGTAFGKAGKGTANEESLVEAIDAGIKMATSKFNL